MEEYRRIFKQITFSITTIILIFLIGIFGFMLLEGWDFFKAFYITAITLSTVGYGMPENISNATIIFDAILIFSGISVVLYLISSLTALFVEGDFKKIGGILRMVKRIENLTNHYIIVGGGKVGKYIIDEFSKNKIPYIVIEKDQERIDKLLEKEEYKNINYIIGDAKDEDILIKAKIFEAKGVLLTLPSDVDNLYISLTAKTLNPSLYIVSNATSSEELRKLLYAGVDNVILPPEITGKRMALMVAKPNVLSFIESTQIDFGETFGFAEIKVPENSWMVGKEFGDLEISKTIDVVVMAIRRNGKAQYNPKSNFKIKPNDSLMVIGDQGDIEKLKRYVIMPQI
ncbi:voltage-gated potassium channel [Marinitoga hydrogenitolerans DSM 16785]|uniref:Voltage-gated potassium channel n=1 Tax=Marinitoga hydrogenitolerans (strain DSM 16785 / JCM 12826 / AT1271) TaxID=1122195 RepID=A0A1M4Z0S2_MARH1|nr:potassium channel protein [Marinitoga hydrogenitolerans]SHF11651.1 voltage-gated potassium channel [Marinitoga hydrogenitolerans DSM 16785]